MFPVRNLHENQLYEFWVSATTGSGEGESTLVVGQGPSARSKFHFFRSLVVALRGVFRRLEGVITKIELTIWLVKLHQITKQSVDSQVEYHGLIKSWFDSHLLSFF